ncbi:MULTISPECIES: DUF488 domain-containing protein [Thermus]|uniref:DUF488 domain-containing protein n=1 Tax=Thermus TaxID=270 RepID=UPI001F47D049|nr:MULTISPECIES: DUF488 domain-containing protein [Thermus]
MRVVYTIGYEGLKLPEFISFLRGKGIVVVADVRELPLSRKPGFSKVSLRAALEDAGIYYRHIRELGAPKPLRDYLKRTGDWPTYRQNYLQLLQQRPGVLEELGMLACEYPTALLCFEADPATCHRSIIAEALLATGWVQEALDLRKEAYKLASSAR